MEPIDRWKTDMLDMQMALRNLRELEATHWEQILASLSSRKPPPPLDVLQDRRSAMLSIWQSVEDWLEKLHMEMLAASTSRTRES